MNTERNNKTLQAISHEIKSLQSNCVDISLNIKNNTHVELQQISPNNVAEKSVQYIEGLRKNIEGSNSPIVNDNNLLTSQFINDLKEKTGQTRELIAYTRGLILDIESENSRLKEMIQIAKKAKPSSRDKKPEVQLEHINAAKEHFQIMKKELQGLIQSMFPNTADDMMNVLGHLMRIRLDETSDGYMSITDETSDLIELLLEMNIVRCNPYNETEVKLAY